MGIHEIFTLEEEIEIISRVTEINEKYDRNCVCDSHRHYFTKLADEYDLPERIEYEMQDYELGIAKKENLTTNKNLARLFGIKHYTSVTGYFQKRIHQEVVR